MRSFSGYGGLNYESDRNMMKNFNLGEYMTNIFFFDQ